MATLRDVAQLAGVSTATVSNVLNSRNERVSAETRQKVLAAVRELKYRPTALEKDQKAILTKNLGVMVPDITKNPITRHGYFRDVLDGIMEGAMFRGWSVTIFAEKLWDDLGLAVRRSYDGRCDGLIVIAPSSINETVPALQERGTPLVLIGATANLPRVSSVDVDNEQVAALIAEHLLALGHRRFCFLGDRPTVVAAVERERSFRKALIDAGIPAEDCETNWERAGGQPLAEYLGAWRERGPLRPTGFFAWHDWMAEAFLRSCRDAGIDVPDDLSLASVDDSPASKDLDPPLTTIPQPLHLIGKRAATLLIDRLAEPDLPDEVVRLRKLAFCADGSAGEGLQGRPDARRRRREDRGRTPGRRRRRGESGRR